jgi:hypothetical protein
MSDWITITIKGGESKRVRKSAISGYGPMPDGSMHVDYNGRMIIVTQTKTELSELEEE